MLRPRRALERGEMSRELDLQALRLLVLLEELGSLGAAGRELGVSQPAASACLRAFEARWQLALAERGPRGTRLTADGAAVSSWARDLLHQVDEVRGGLAALSAESMRGGLVLGVAASLTVAEFVLPRWIGELHRSMPEVQLRLQVSNSEAVDHLIRTGQCELGFVESVILPPGLASAVVGSDRLVVVAHASHPCASRREPLAVEELLDNAFVLREQGSGTRETFLRALGTEPSVAMVATSTAALVGAVLAGVGPAVVTPRAVRRNLATGELVEIRHDLDLERPLTAVWRPEHRLGDAATALLAIAGTSGARLD